MATFKITTPDAEYSIEAPDEKSALEAFQREIQPEAPSRGLGTRLDDVMRGVADTASFGFADEASAGMGAMTGVGGKQGDYAGNVANQRARDEAGGWERFGGQVAGAFLNPFGVGKSLMGAVGSGALSGGLYGLGSGEGNVLDRAPSAVTGAAVGGAMGGAVRTVANQFAAKAAAKHIPTTDDLKKVAQAGYKAAENADVIYRPEAMREMAQEVVNDLTEFGYHPQLQPRIKAILSEIERLGQGNFDYKSLDLLRRMTSNAGQSLDPSERAIATKIIARIDDVMMDPQVRNVLMGDAVSAAEGIAQGRNNWARMRRAEMVDTATIKAERRAASTGTGGNLENTIRQNIRGILDNPRRSRGMTQAEIDMAEKVVRGTPTQNVLRQVGRLSPTTGGLSAALNVGATAVNPLMATFGAVGLGAKTMADRMTMRNVQRLNEIIRSGGKTGEDLLKLARGGQLKVPELRKIEALAKMFGMTLPEMTAVVSEQVQTAAER